MNLWGSWFYHLDSVGLWTFDNLFKTELAEVTLYVIQNVSLTRLGN